MTYDICRKMIRHNAPDWTTSGEITNSDRFSIAAKQKFGHLPKFIRKEQDPMLADKVWSILDENIKPVEYVYKDVTQPFLVAEWLAAHDYPTLILHRHPVDVAFAMWQKEWFYPAASVSLETTLKRKMMTGLCDAQKVLATVQGVSVHFEQMLHDETLVQSALKELYCSNTLPVVRYLYPEFRNYSSQVKLRKENPLYQEFLSIYEDLQSAPTQPKPNLPC